MIGFIGTSVTSSLNHTQLQRYRRFTQFQFTAGHALGFSVCTSCLLATDLNTETGTSVTLKFSCYVVFRHSVLLCPNLHSQFTNCSELPYTALIKVTDRLLISLYYSRHKVFKSHDKSSQANFSTLTACLLLLTPPTYN
jgi:hypothetical protein